MATSSDLHFYGTNSQGTVDGASGHDNLGGVRSADELFSLTTLPLNQLKGVTVSRVANYCDIGRGVLTFLHTTGFCSWKAPGDTAGTSVLLVNGTNRLYSANVDKWIELTVVTGSLPAVDVTETVIIDALPNVLFPNTRLGDGKSGIQTYAALWVKNTGSAMVNFRPTFDTGITNGAILPDQDYPHSGGFKVDGGPNILTWPSSGYFRNLSTFEIMYYYARTGSKLLVGTLGRRLRGTSRGSGFANDVLEYVGACDLAWQVPTGSPLKGTTILDNRIPPAGLTFEYPSDPLAVQSTLLLSSFTSDLIVWFRRNMPVNAEELVRQTTKLQFVFE